MTEESVGVFAPYGDVESRFEDVLRLASYRWRRKITHVDVARRTGLNRKTIDLLASSQTQFYDLHTLTLLCWYFGNQPADLLLPAPSGEAGATPMLQPTIGRKEPPQEEPPGKGAIWIINSTPELLKDFSEEAIVKGMHVHRKEADQLKKRPNRRIGRATLAKLLNFLSRERDQPVGIETVLVYHAAPLLSQTESP